MIVILIESWLRLSRAVPPWCFMFMLFRTFPLTVSGGEAVIQRITNYFVLIVRHQRTPRVREA